MLFDISLDPHEEHDLAAERPDHLAIGRSLLEDWTAEQLDRSLAPIDPMQIVLDEGGPYHTRRQLPTYLDRLRETGRSAWADTLVERHPGEADPEFWET
jgi:hypothetical protein